MSDEIKNNDQSAFPCTWLDYDSIGELRPRQQFFGLTKREEFAKTFLAAMISSPPIVDRTKVDKKKWGLIAIEWADVLLTELAKEGGEK